MLRHVPQPLDAGRLVGRVGLAGADVDPARDRLVDDGLLLLLQQRDQLLLGADVASNAPLGVVKKADDGDLFGQGWKGKRTISVFLSVNVFNCRNCPGRLICHVGPVSWGAVRSELTRGLDGHFGK